MAAGDTPGFVGGAHWYKNRTGLIKIFGELSRILPSRPLLIHVGPPLDPEQQGLAVQYALKDSLIHIPSLDNDELGAAYSLAEGLIFPSWEEGFGWPVAEAQACGCPVFASNRAPMTEVGGPAARYFDPDDPVAAAQAIASGPDEREDLRSAGLQRARLWDPARMFDDYHSLYDRILSLNSPRLSARP
jgi:glycosyltransferase involved in cell wall biosynthesis